MREEMFTQMFDIWKSKFGYSIHGQIFDGSDSPQQCKQVFKNGVIQNFGCGAKRQHAKKQHAKNQHAKKQHAKRQYDKRQHVVA